MFSSEQHFVINGENKNDLEKVLKLALDLADYKSVKAFYKDPKGLVLCWYECKGSTPYPFEATIPVLVEQIMQYLNSLTTDEIFNLAGNCPDIDGSVELGWEVFHPLWYGENDLENYTGYEIIAIRPSWVIYGK